MDSYENDQLNEQQLQPFNWTLHAHIDCLDTVGKWCDAVIIDIR